MYFALYDNLALLKCDLLNTLKKMCSFEHDNPPWKAKNCCPISLFQVLGFQKSMALVGRDMKMDRACAQASRGWEDQDTKWTQE